MPHGQISRNIRFFNEAYREFQVHLRNLSLADTKAERMTAGRGLHLKTDLHIACRAHATPMPFPCRAVPCR